MKVRDRKSWGVGSARTKSEQQEKKKKETARGFSGWLKSWRRECYLNFTGANCHGRGEAGSKFEGDGKNTVMPPTIRQSEEEMIKKNENREGMALGNHGGEGKSNHEKKNVD